MNNNDLIDKFKDSFKEESIENISDIEHMLLNIEDDGYDSEVINSIFRNFHTIKGSAGMFGFNMTAEIVHEVETALDGVKQGAVKFSQDSIDSTLMLVDFIRELIEGDENIAKEEFKERQSFLINNINNSLSNSPKSDSSSNSVITEEKSEKIESTETVKSEQNHDLDDDYFVETKIYKIIFIPAKGILFHGHHPIKLIGKLLNLGEGEVRARVNNIPDLERIESSNVYVYWEIKLITEESKENLEDIFIFLDDQSKLTIEEVDKYYEIPDESSLPTDYISSSNEDIVLDSPTSNNNILETPKSVAKPETTDTLNNNDFVSKPTKNNLAADDNSKTKVNISSIKVDSKKLDHLVNLVGELVTIQSKLTKEAENQGSNMLNSISAEFALLINELRDYTTALRTVPIEILFIKFQRVVKDLSSELGKSIFYDTKGGDTVLDKSIIEKLNEPLIHLIRNSIDHGIETIEERKQVGKDPTGLIRLSAYQSGDSVVIVIEDDGKGLDSDKILKKAVEKKIVNESLANSLSKNEIYNLIFEPGFSTASSITSISGRGVGMDVVRKQVESLRGTVVLESEFGKYTRTKLIFPLTLAIIEGWLVRVKTEYFIIPLSSVEYCLDAEDVLSSIDGIQNRSNVMNYRGAIISCIRLREFFGIDNEKSEESEQVVVINTTGGKIGLLVDEILGQYQTVIKTLGKLYSKVDGVSGASILGDGSLALVIDIDSMTKFMR